LIAAKLLDVNPENAIVFEDSVAGVQAANIGKMTSIGIGKESILYEAKYVFKDFTHIEKAL
jgi:beta-phosphoglucomutase